MAADENLFIKAASAGLGQLQALKPPPPPQTAPPVEIDSLAKVSPEVGPFPDRFSLVTRKGYFWSYPYAYVGLIECETPELVVIHCNSPEVETIEIHGQQLAGLAQLLTARRLVSVQESDLSPFARRDGTIVNDIVLVAGRGNLPQNIEEFTEELPLEE